MGVTLKGHRAALGAFQNARMSNGQGIQNEQQQQQRVDPNHTTSILVDEVAS